MKIRELQSLLNDQPRVSSSTFLVGTLYILSWILGIFHFILSIGLFLEATFGFHIFLNWVCQQIGLILNENQRIDISFSIALISLFLGIIFVGVIFLCKMILKRNHFIIQIEDWVYHNISEIKKNTKKH